MADTTKRRRIASGGMNDIGTSGLNIFGGFIQEAYTPELQWPGAYTVYNDMRRRNPTLRSLLNAIIMLAKKPRWKFEAQDEETVSEEAVEFGNSVIDDMGVGFPHFIEDALSALVFGWSVSEICYGRRDPNWRFGDESWVSNYDDGLIGWRKFAFRRQSSWDQWEIDEATGRISGMWQQDSPNPRVLLPMHKLVHFIPFRDGDNPEGWCLLESCYEPYYYNKSYGIILGVGLERSLVGWPVFEYGQTPSAADEARVKAAATSLMAGAERGYLTTPPNVKFRFETVANPNATVLLDVMKHYDLKMLTTVLADFINLGSGETGSWSLGSDKSELFVQAMNGVLTTLGDTLNMGAVRELFRVNGAAFPGLQKLPRLTHSGIRKTMMPTDLATFISTLSSSMVLTKGDEIRLREASQGLLSEAQVEPGTEGDPMDRPGEMGMGAEEPFPGETPEEAAPEDETLPEDETGEPEAELSGEPLESAVRSLTQAELEALADDDTDS